MKFALFHFLLFFSFVGSGQRLDSLKAELVKDPNNLAILNDLAYEYTYEDLDSARMLLTRAIKLNSTDSLQLGISKETLAIVDEIQGKIPLLLHFTMKASQYLKRSVRRNTLLGHTMVWELCTISNMITTKHYPIS